VQIGLMLVEHFVKPVFLLHWGLLQVGSLLLPN